MGPKEPWDHLAKKEKMEHLDRWVHQVLWGPLVLEEKGAGRAQLDHQA